jgi:DNA-directed RNA polymerase specialized sigma24 family protein
VTTPPTDIELVGRVVSGDHEAFEAIMHQHEDCVFSVCLRIMGDRERALDSTQETFLRPEIRTALDALPREFRAAIVLSDIEGMSMPEVSEVLGVPVGTVKSRVFRGRRLMAQRLGVR